MSKPTSSPQKDLELGKTILKNLVMGGTAGIIGACCTYPLDMVKTLLQNQKTLPGGQRQYNGVVDCFLKIFRKDGIRGLYRGLPTQLVILCCFFFFFFNLFKHKLKGWNYS